MSYIGQTLPADTFQGFTTDSFAGDGSATTFTLSKTPFNESALLVVINNVVQKPTTNFTVSGTTLTIVGTAVASGDVIYATHIGGALPIGQAASLDLNGASDQLILDADADTTISADTDDQIDIKIGGTDALRVTGTALTGNAVATIGATGTASSLAGIPFYNGDTTSIYTHDVSGTDSTAQNNTAYGLTALDAITTGDDNVAIGYGALSALTTGSDNVAIGSFALDATQSADFNTAIGYQAGTAVTSGGGNVFIGYNAGEDWTEGGDSVLIGYRAGANITTGNNIIFIGKNSGDGHDTEGENIGIGMGALGGAIAGGENNTAIGNNTLDALTTGDYNVAIGHDASTNATTSVNTVAVGRLALRDMTTAGGDSVGYSIGIGAYGMYNVVDNGPNIGIGGFSRASGTSGTNQIVLGYNVAGSGDNTFTFGSGSSDTTVTLGATSFSNPSDERWKKDIETSTCGLSFINDLRPVSFKFKTKGELDSSLYNYEKDSTEVAGFTSDTVLGFIAQEIKTVIDNHSEFKGSELWKEGIEEYDKRQRISKEALIPILVKAVQELSTKVKALEDA